MHRIPKFILLFNERGINQFTLQKDVQLESTLCGSTVVQWFVLSSCNQRVVGSKPTWCMCPQTRHFIHIISLDPVPGVVNGYPAGIYSFKCTVRRYVQVAGAKAGVIMILPTSKILISYVQTVPNHRRLLIIDDKSLPHKQRRAFTRLLIFKIKFLSEPPSR